MTFDDNVIAIIGVAKNCGKTTTLNQLAAAAAAAGKTLGLASVGIDGERKDVLLGTEKPPVRVRGGEFFATTRQALGTSTGAFELVADLGFSTPLGEAVIARAENEAEIILAGMRHLDDVADAVGVMQRLGAEQVWIDGSYGRVSSAQPGLVDGVIVATGAIVGESIELMLDKTASLMDRLQLPIASAQDEQRAASKALQDNAVYVLDPTPRRISDGSALTALSKITEAWSERANGIAIPGLVSETVVHAILSLEPAGTLVLRDPTVLQVDGRLLQRLRRRWRVCVAARCPVLGLSFNPTSVVGDDLPPEMVRAALSDRYPKTPVFDPLVDIHWS